MGGRKLCFHLPIMAPLGRLQPSFQNSSKVNSPRKYRLKAFLVHIWARDLELGERKAEVLLPLAHHGAGGLAGDRVRLAEHRLCEAFGV